MIVVPDGASSGPEHAPHQPWVCCAHRNENVSILGIQDAVGAVSCIARCRTPTYYIPDNVGQLTVRWQMKIRIIREPSVYIRDTFGLDTRWQAMCFAVTEK